MDLAILRLIHIVAGAFWFGALYTFFLFVQPTAMAIGPEGQKFTYHLLHHKRFSLILLASAITTVLAGIVLLWITTEGFDGYLLFDMSRLGFTVGGVLGILALGLGALYVFPRTRIVERTLGAALGAGRPPTDEERATLMRAGGESRVAGKWVLVGVGLAVLCMATARYWSTFL
ncbi:MAG: hypothetical protein ABI622_04790 [Chloroflexota bacterium]